MNKLEYIQNKVKSYYFIETAYRVYFAANNPKNMFVLVYNIYLFIRYYKHIKEAAKLETCYTTYKLNLIHVTYNLSLWELNTYTENIFMHVINLIV